MKTIIILILSVIAIFFDFKAVCAFIQLGACQGPLGRRKSLKNFYFFGVIGFIITSIVLWLIIPFNIFIKIPCILIGYIISILILVGGISYFEAFTPYYCEDGYYGRIDILKENPQVYISYIIMFVISFIGSVNLNISLAGQIIYSLIGAFELLFLLYGYLGLIFEFNLDLLDNSILYEYYGINQPPCSSDGNVEILKDKSDFLDAANEDNNTDI